MPLDIIEFAENPLLEKLGKVERLLATEQQWCKGKLRDADGPHCLVGAIEAADASQELPHIILRATREVTEKRYWRIESSTTTRARCIVMSCSSFAKRGRTFSPKWSSNAIHSRGTENEPSHCGRRGRPLHGTSVLCDRSPMGPHRTSRRVTPRPQPSHSIAGVLARGGIRPPY